MFDASAGHLKVSDVAEMLEISEEGVRKRVRAGSLIGMNLGRRLALPSIQFIERTTVPQLGTVLTAIELDSPWMKLEWLVTPEPRLADRKPIDVLAGGSEVDSVVAAARMVGHHGAA